MTNSIGHNPFGGIFANETLVRVMGWFLQHPDAERYQRELASELGLTLHLAQRELARLVDFGLVRRTERGRQVYYRADRSHPAFADLRNVFLKTVGLGATLRDALEPAIDRVDLAFLFGSVARGTESTQSDLDLLVVGDIGLRGVSSLVGPVARRMGREPNLVTYSRHEFLERVGDEDHFVNSVLRGPKIWIVGDDDEIGRLAR